MKIANFINKILNVSKKKYLITLISVIAFIALVYYYFISLVNPLIIKSSEAQVKSLTLKAVNNAIADVLAESVLYNDLVNIVTDENGKIVMLNANSILINKFSKELVKSAQNKLKTIGDEGMQIPLGNFTGIPLLTGIGPNIKVRLIPIGSIHCNFESKFQASGINQTHHMIYVNVEASVNMVLPVQNISVTSVSQVLISESIIVGEVPQTYLQSDNIQDMLDLIPS
mgnify:CR=1 FL=1